MSDIIRYCIILAIKNKNMPIRLNGSLSNANHRCKSGTALINAPRKKLVKINVSRKGSRNIIDILVAQPNRPRADMPVINVITYIINVRSITLGKPNLLLIFVSIKVITRLVKMGTAIPPTNPNSIESIERPA